MGLNKVLILGKKSHWHSEPVSSLLLDGYHFPNYSDSFLLLGCYLDSEQQNKQYQYRQWVLPRSCAEISWYRVMGWWLRSLKVSLFVILRKKIPLLWIQIWAVSIDGAGNWFCFGDTNNENSQITHGGIEVYKKRNENNNIDSITLADLLPRSELTRWHAWSNKENSKPKILDPGHRWQSLYRQYLFVHHYVWSFTSFDDVKQWPHFRKEEERIPTRRLLHILKKKTTVEEI